MTEKLKVAAQQALEALRYHGAANLRSGMEAIVALEAALAEPEPAQEPVAWMWEETASRTSTGIGGVDRKLLFCRPVDEPWKRNITPLYTHPPQRPPLTDEEINDCLPLDAVRLPPGLKEFARRIERKLRGKKE